MSPFIVACACICISNMHLDLALLMSAVLCGGMQMSKHVKAGLLTLQGVSKTFEEHDGAISPALPQLVSHVRSGAQVNPLTALHLHLLPSSLSHSS